MQLSIDPALDPASMAKVFRRLGRLHIPGFLAGDGADRVASALAGAEVPWIKTWRTTGPSLDGDLAQFDAWRVSDDIDKGLRRGGAVAPIEAVHDFVSSAAFLGFVEALNVFAIPSAHAVSYVAPFAGANRHAVTGWVRY